MKLDYLSNNGAILKLRKMAFMLLENNQGVIEIEPKKPQTMMIMKVFDNKGEKTDLNGRKYSLVKCEGIQIMATMEGRC